LHIWPRGGYMMMAMANVDGSFTVTLYLAFEGPRSFAQLDSPGAVRDFFQREFPDALPLLPDLETGFLAHPTGTLVTVRTAPWHLGGSAVLLGDAAHAIVPFYGQGANAAFEDALALAAALTRRDGDRAAAFREYEMERRPNAEAIADLALANFREMRDQVASPLFRLEKRGELLLNRIFPRWFLPLYTMISFTLIPYAEARARARRQRRTLGAILLLLALGLAAILVRLFAR
jgi:kynurenine 3-monooxygenase